MGMKGYTKKQRGVERRKRNRFVFISAEGRNKTETIYFRRLSVRSVRFKFVSGSNTDPVKMSEDLIKKMQDDGFDSEIGDLAYCLVDGDNSAHKNQQIEQADILGHKHGFKVIFSNPCFEVWYICHFKYTAKQYASSKEAIEELKKCYPNYSKSDTELRGFPLEKISTAVENARKLEEWNEKQPGRKKHTVSYLPCTEVFKMIEEAGLL